jgi:ATP-dependent DNA helicase RecQ
VARRLGNELVREVVTVVARLNGRVGLTRVAGVLTGSRSKAVLELPGVTDMAGYGMLRGWRGADAEELLHRLIEGGTLRQTVPPYPTVALTPAGIAVLRGETIVDIDDPRQPERKVPAASTAGGGSAPGSAPAAETARFERLRAWRTEQARERNVPPYVVFPDRTLVELAARLPASDRELLAVPGVGAAKLAIYGRELLGMLADMRAEAGVEA